MAEPLSQSEIIRRLEERRPGSTTGSYLAYNNAEWFCQFEQDVTECDIPSTQHQETAFMVLPGTIKIEMTKQRRQGPCDWDVFKEVIVDAIIHLTMDENAEREISELVKLWEEMHPGCMFGCYPVPNSSTMEEWFQRFETDFEECNTPSHLRHYTACLVLPAFIQKALFDKPGWERLSWITFKLVLTILVNRPLAQDRNVENDESSPESSSDSNTLLKTAAVVGGAGLIAAGRTVLVPLAIIGGLNVVGFGAGGVIGGSLAASMQSALYGGATGGLFSICQSIAATTAVPAAGAIISVAAGAAARSALTEAGIGR